jgi:hypothetical protein
MGRAIRLCALVALVAMLGCTAGAASTSPDGLPGPSTLTPAVPAASVPAPTTSPTAAATDPTPSPTASATSSASATPAAGTNCTVRSIDYAPDAVGVKGAPATLARAALTGLQPTDQLTVADGDAGRQLVRVARDGTQIVELSYVGAGDGAWLLETGVLCDGGLGWR